MILLLLQGLMSMLCAPVRDDQIQALKTQTEVVHIFKGKSYRTVPVCDNVLAHQGRIQFLSVFSVKNLTLIAEI